MCNYLSPMYTCSWANIDNPVRTFNDFLVMFYDNNSISDFSQFEESVYQQVIVSLM